MDPKTQIIAFAASYLVSLLNGYLRKATWFKWVQPDDKQAAQIMVAIISAIAAIIIALVSGNPVDNSMGEQLLRSLVDFAMILGGSTFFHHWIIKAPSTTENTKEVVE
jgi:hypothetical protein